MKASHLSRRRLLQHAGAGAALCLLPASIARAALAGENKGAVLDDGWEFMRLPLAGPWEVWSGQPLAPWARVTVPHCFNSEDACDPDVPAYRGKGWYRRRLQTAQPYSNGKTLLHFEGAGQSCEVYLDGHIAARHVGGYDEFVVDVSRFVEQPGASAKGAQLSVLCDNSPDLERLPSDLSDFTLYGGLYRSVHLVYVPAVSLEAVHVQVDAGPGRPARVKAQARLYNPDQLHGPARVTVTITDPHRVVVHQMEKTVEIWDGMDVLTSFELSAPQLWSPATPQLYECRVAVNTVSGESVVEENFGVRFFQFVEKGPFLLNGERLLIQGTHRHEDHTAYAAAMPAMLIRQEMKLIKEMGANFIRLAHYQQQKLVLDLCDELGLLVWEEVPWCRAGIGDEAFQAQGREKLRTMIDQHYNHPSIILWGLGNEDDWPGEYPSLDAQAIRKYMQSLNELAHQLDPSRMTSFRRCEFARDIPDVYSPSIWAGWYGGRFVDYEKSLTEQRDKSGRMLHVEWGADSHARRHAEEPYKLLTTVKEGDTAESGLAYLLQGGIPRVSSDGDWSETYACDLFDWHLKVQQSLPWLSGAVQWVFKDFTTPLRAENPIPRVNQKGLIERDMTLKEGYYVFQSYWAHKPMAHIYGHSWPVRWGHLNQLRSVKVYSNCPQAELFLNGKSAGIRHRDSQNFPAAGLRWDLGFRPGENTLRVVAKASGGETVTDELKFSYQTDAWAAPAKLALRVKDASPGRATIEATLVDAQGVLCLDARNVIRFSVAGQSKLIDNGGTSSTSRVTQLQNGRCTIGVVLATTAATIGVSSEGIAPAFCPLPPARSA